MYEPRDKDNYLIEITPETMDEINRIWMQAEVHPVVELHYSPNWRKKPNANKQ